MDIALFDECQSQIGAEEYKTIVEERNYRIQNGEFFLSVAPSIAIVSLICAICVVILIGIAMMKQNVSKRKFIVILSRTSTDIISSLIIAGIGILANLEAAYFSVTALCLFVCTFGFIHTTLCDAFIILIRQGIRILHSRNMKRSLNKEKDDYLHEN
uniref:G-protein coupled receptors family 1 profile domain-containing protein n=1 Tax=Acrobeloides nanus TaxID=290746 RepID=A0A914DKB4_9BILA